MRGVGGKKSAKKCHLLFELPQGFSVFITTNAYFYEDKNSKRLVHMSYLLQV